MQTARTLIATLQTLAPDYLDLPLKAFDLRPEAVNPFTHNVIGVSVRYLETGERLRVVILSLSPE